PAGRHLQVRIGVAQRLQQPALLWFPRHDRRSELSTLEHTGPGIEHELAFRRRERGGMTGVALARQDGANPGLEEVTGDRRHGLRANGSGNQAKHEHAGDYRSQAHQTSGKALLAGADTPAETLEILPRVIARVS